MVHSLCRHLNFLAEPSTQALMSKEYVIHNEAAGRNFSADKKIVTHIPVHI